VVATHAAWFDAKYVTVTFDLLSEEITNSAIITTQIKNKYVVVS
jgi:hypothetical protein